MNILLYHNSIIPPAGYGGIERVVFWLAREFNYLGHNVWLLANKESSIEKMVPGVKLIAMPEHSDDYVKFIPEEIDIIHFHENPSFIPSKPFVVTIHGNGSANERYLPNTVFLSKSHAKSHNATHFVYNGVPVSDYEGDCQKEEYLLFLANLNWRVKNGKTAIKLAVDSNTKLYLAGGRLSRAPKVWGRHNLQWQRISELVTSLGRIGGVAKHEYIKKAMLLFYCVNWIEPFALAPHEALASGTPVLASTNGALTEYIEDKKNGYIVHNYAEALAAINYHKKLSLDAQKEMSDYCRTTAFSAASMAKNYIEVYQQVLKEKFIYPPEKVKEMKFTPVDIVKITK